ncbi:MAG: TRAP transporter substrate-binding protein DctP [Rhodospirillaceae bacterium]|nr:TRAP transporter substrate-binding protein DctP [Rhodospirillaceae bacterium]
MRKIGSAIPLALALAAVQQPAVAKEYKLTVAAASPAIVTPAFVTKTYFVPTMTKRADACGDKIVWNEGYGQSIAKFGEVLEAVEEGIAHVGVMLRNFEEAKLPLDQYPSVMPFVVADPKLMTEIDAAVRKKVPAIDKMYEKYGQIYLAGGAEHSMQLFSKFPVKKYEDLKGHKIGGSGALGNYIRGTGAVLVNSSMLDSYTSIKNGLYDGYPIIIYLAFPYKTYEVAKQYTVTDFGSTTVAALTVNAKAWATFSDCLKKAFRETAEGWSQQYVKVNTERMEKFTPLIKKSGVAFSTLSPAERKRWAMVLPPLAKQWATALEAKGLPANAVVKAFMEEARARSINPPREWDKE